jgi:2-methylcitrate dehydratase PrpD
MSGSPSQVNILAEFAANSESIPESIKTDARERILDVIGNSLAGRAESLSERDPDRAVERLVERWGGQPTSTIIGNKQKVPASNAALMNGTLAHILDFDDTHLPSILHPSASVVPASLAVAEEVGANSDQLLRAVAVGIEISNRIGMASYLPSVGNSIFFEKGFHATSICGTIASAASAGILYGLSSDGIASAMGIGASMGAGIIEANRTGGTVKRIHCGWAAHAGIVAAGMASEGITGPPTVLEGRFGFFNAYLDGQYDKHALLDDLGTRWEILNTAYKPYPTNHFTHPGIDCALEIRKVLKDKGIDPRDIARIELGVAKPVIRTIGEPREEKILPKSGYHGKFSAPYTVATAFIGGGGLGVYLDDFDERNWNQTERLALASKVEVFEDDIATKIFPNALAAVMHVTTNAGEKFSHRVNASRGSKESPLSHAEILLKFSLNASRYLPTSDVEQIKKLIEFKDETDFTQLMATLTHSN